MRVVVVSDTHNQHEDLGTLSGDVLIHCGDMFSLFGRSDDDLAAIDDWFGLQRFERVFCTGGNHDVVLEHRLADDPQPFRNAYYLQDETVEHDGIQFHGAPWVPQLRGHAFYRSGAELSATWASIVRLD